MAKSPEAFRTISEAAQELGVAQHVLRFWESRFPFIRPTKTAGGRRFYRPADLALLATIRRLLQQDGYTIKGVRKLHKEQGPRRFVGGQTERPSKVSIEVREPIGGEARTGPFDQRRLADILGGLEAAKTRLDAAMNDR